MDFSTGNSGNTLLEAVVKIGPGCQQEGSFCQFLGHSVTPRVYAILPDGYVMEALNPALRHPRLLVEITKTLGKLVWPRPPLPISTDTTWREALEKFGVKVREDVIETDPCLVHGDPTASNALVRFLPGCSSQLIIGDPRPPRDFIPQNRETDMGRILQSYLGWEVAAYGAARIEFDRPWFMDDQKMLNAAKFWCGAAAARIEHLERTRNDRNDSMRRSAILKWCADTRYLCNV